MMEQFSVIRKHLKKKLDPRRFEHTLGVEFTCAALAMRYGYDIKKAQLAGLLHDCAKRYPGPELLRRCLEREIPTGNPSGGVASPGPVLHFAYCWLWD